jgi:hypothetical protein
MKAYYTADVLNCKACDKGTTNDIILKKVINFGISFTSYFTNPFVSYGASLRVISDYRNRTPTDSIINTLYWSWATVLDQSYRDVRSAATSIKLQRADTTDLDTIGEVYHLGRLVGESDELYRKRLSTQTNVLIGHGTKATCESIIDQVTGVTGCNVVTSSPATIRIEFDNDAAMRAAYSLRDTIESIIPDMIAAGITWQFYTPIYDLPMTLGVFGTDECPYTMFVYNQQFHNKAYDMDTINVLRLLKTYDMDILNLIAVNKTYAVGGFVLKAATKTHIMDILNKLGQNKTYNMICPNEKRNLTQSISIDEMTKKLDINKSYSMDELSKRAKVSKYKMGMMVV